MAIDPYLYPGTEFWFCRHQLIQQSLGDLFKKLVSENKLINTTVQQFGFRAGYYMGELNAVHPFPEGNGRTQREFIRVLGLNTNLEVDWSRVTQEEMYAASIVSFQSGDYRPLGDMITRITSRLTECL
jgi:cell filamentation protein